MSRNKGNVHRHMVIYIFCDKINNIIGEVRQENKVSDRPKWFESHLLRQLGNMDFCAIFNQFIIIV